MKNLHIFGILSIIICSLVVNQSAMAQRCDKKELCEDDFYSDYDFKSQTHFAKLSPGDTATINIVAYSANDVRILVCAEEELGEIKYQIIEPIREVKRIMKLSAPRTETTYKLNAQGEQEQDENGNPIPTGEITVRDTTYESKTNIIEKLIYDNSKGNKDKPYYEEKNIQKTKRLKIKLQIPAGADEEFVGCVSVLVGRKSAKSNKFYRNKD